MTTTQTTAIAVELREQANRHEAEARASFERCDTDGFLSQWASGLSAQKDRRQADIIEAGGVARFIALFDLNGNWVPAQMIDGKYGRSWMLLDAEGKRTGEYAPYLPKRRDTLAKRGYVEGYVMRPAKADIVSGRGGMASCRVVSVPLTRDWEPPVSVVSSDRWSD
jgi:hypothetical protein